MTRAASCRIRYVVTCSDCGDVADVETMAEGVAVADAHEAEHNGLLGPVSAAQIGQRASGTGF